LNFLESFQTIQIDPGQLSKVVGVVPPAFQEDCSSKAYLADFKSSEIGQGQLKLLVQL
jgi:hypothetical protein